MSRKKVQSLATVLLLPVILWFATGYLMADYVLGLGRPAAFTVAAILAFMIFIIERNIIMAVGRGLVIIRVLIGLITALLGSVALDEVIFKYDIDQQMAMNKVAMIDGRKARIDSAFAEEIRMQSSIVSQELAKWHEAVDIARQEADGTGGSGHAGVSDITRMKQQAAADIRGSYNQAKIALDALIARLNGEKISAGAGIEDMFINSALLQRIKALFDLIRTDRYMLAIYILITAFIFFIEFVVVIMKITWKKTHYERELEAIESMGERRLQRIILHDAEVFDAGDRHPRSDSSRDFLQKIANNVNLF